MAVDNSIDHLHPDLARVYAEAKATYLAKYPNSLRPRLGETYRSNAVQAAYFAQGRQPLAAINALRHTAGLNPLGQVEAQRQITKAQPGQSAHNFLPARAFDVQLVKPNGEINWNDIEYQVFAVHVRNAAAKLGVAVSQGAYWPSFKDFPHCELLNWRTMH